MDLERQRSQLSRQCQEGHAQKLGWSMNRLSKKNLPPKLAEQENNLAQQDYFSSKNLPARIRESFSNPKRLELASMTEPLGSEKLEKLSLLK